MKNFKSDHATVRGARTFKSLVQFLLSEIKRRKARSRRLRQENVSLRRQLEEANHRADEGWSRAQDGEVQITHEREGKALPCCPRCGDSACECLNCRWVYPRP